VPIRRDANGRFSASGAPARRKGRLKANQKRETMTGKALSAMMPGTPKSTKRTANRLANLQRVNKAAADVYAKRAKRGR
jgi:hypothetical protein